MNRFVNARLWGRQMTQSDFVRIYHEAGVASQWMRRSKLGGNRLLNEAKADYFGAHWKYRSIFISWLKWEINGIHVWTTTTPEYIGLVFLKEIDSILKRHEKNIKRKKPYDLQCIILIWNGMPLSTKHFQININKLQLIRNISSFCCDILLKIVKRIFPSFRLCHNDNKHFRICALF